MKIIYLDQNHWIEIAKYENSKNCKPGTKEAISDLIELANNGDAIFPISHVHYMETWKRNDDKSRSKLSESMLKLSGGYTTAPPKVIIKHEVVCWIIKLLDLKIDTPSFTYLTKGISGAFNLGFRQKIEWPKEVNLTEKQKADLETDLQKKFESSALSSIANGKSFSKKQNLESDVKFQKTLEKWKEHTKNIKPEEINKKIYKILLKDLLDLEIIQNTIRELDLDQDSTKKIFEKIEENSSNIINQLPSQIVLFSLWKEWSKQPNLKPKESDLNDWTAASNAVPYCDIFVTENQMYSLLCRSGEYKNKVTNSLTKVREYF